MKKLTYLLSLLLLPPAAVAQDGFCLSVKELVPGTCQNPTPELVLHALATTDRSEESLNAIMDAIEAVLRQVFEPRSMAELAAFAAELGRVYQDAPDDVGNAIVGGLGGSSSEYTGGKGTPYAGAVEVFIRLYESYEGPPAGARDLLSEIRYLGGDEYLRGRLASLEPSPPCTWPPQSRMFGEPVPSPPENPCPSKTEWCNVAGVLLTREGPLDDLYYSLCVTAAKIGGEWFRLRY